MTPRSQTPAPSIRSRTAAPLAAAALVVCSPAAVVGQFGPIEALATRMSDLSFYFATGGLTTSATLEPNHFGVRSFGVELLFEVAQIPSAEARRRREAAVPTTARVLERIEVRHTHGSADTTYHYVVRQVPPAPFGPDDIVWTMEVGIGYGQIEGLRLRDPGLELNATVRNLPALTLYVSHEPSGAYLGLRTGFMRTDALQLIDAQGGVFRGRAEAFAMGALLGYAFALPPAFLFLEAGHTLRAFPSVEWLATPGPLPPSAPRRLDVSGWMLAAGIQFPVR
jgi:hypothetical protein